MKKQLVGRLLFLLVNIVVNAYILSTGGLSFDYSRFIVLFNAAMIMVIYLVDFSIVKAQRRRIASEIGEGLIALHRHER